LQLHPLAIHTKVRTFLLNFKNTTNTVEKQGKTGRINLRGEMVDNENAQQQKQSCREKLREKFADLLSRILSEHQMMSGAAV
jgi:hypothetical protein